MNRPGKRSVFDEETINRAKKVVDSLGYRDPVLMAFSVLLAGVLNLTSEEIGEMLGVSRCTVIRMNKQFRNNKERGAENWGGDRRSFLSKDGQQELLESLEKQAREGKIVVVAQVKTVLEEKYGKPITLQTAYNLLYRHGWRKVKPDKVHPKSDPLAQEEFKKKHFQRRWIWLPPVHMK